MRKLSKKILVIGSMIFWQLSLSSGVMEAAMRTTSMATQTLTTAPTSAKHSAAITKKKKTSVQTSGTNVKSTKKKTVSTSAKSAKITASKSGKTKSKPTTTMPNSKQSA